MQLKRECEKSVETKNPLIAQLLQMERGFFFRNVSMSGPTRQNSFSSEVISAPFASALSGPRLCLNECSKMRVAASWMLKRLFRRCAHLEISTPVRRREGAISSTLILIYSIHSFVADGAKARIFKASEKDGRTVFPPGLRINLQGEIVTLTHCGAPGG